MIRLMKLEFIKVGFKKYVMFSMAGILISMFFLFVALNDSSTTKSGYETAFTTVEMIFCMYYIPLFSVLVSSYIINEYTHKTILVMFSYPINRKKLMAAKLLLITLLVMFSMVIGYICCGAFIIMADKYWGLIKWFYIAGMNLHEENWPFVIGVTALTMTGVYYTLTHKIEQVD